MKSNLIKSGVTAGRKAPVALLLSIVSPGLGQVYCGRLSRGSTYAASLLLAALLLPLSLVIRPDEPSLRRAAVLAGAYIIIILACHAEAALSAMNAAGFTLKKYNTAWAYALFGVISLALQCSAILFVLSHYSAAAIDTDSMDPSFRRGERALLARPPLRTWKAGDAVVFSANGATGFGRIIAVAGEKAGRTKGRIEVNGVPLSLGIFQDRELARRGITNHENLFYEVSGNRKYPVLASPGRGDGTADDVAPATVPGDSVMVAFDNRTARPELVILPVSSLRGRMEGVVFSENWRRLFLLSHYPL